MLNFGEVFTSHGAKMEEKTAAGCGKRIVPRQAFS
jgi:hypothetical protein